MSSQLLFVEMQKEKRSFVKLSALSLPSLQGDIRKTRKTIFSPMRVRKSGQEIGLLLKVAAPLTAIQKTNVIPPFKPFVSTRLFSKYPDTRGGQGSVLKNDYLLDQENNCYLHLQQEGRLAATATSTDCTAMAGTNRSS